MQAVERALDVALIVMQNGGSTAAAEHTFRNVLKGYGLEGVDVAWRLDLVLVSGTADGQASTTLRPVGAVGVNLARASGAAALGERLASGKAATATIDPEIERIKALPSPYNRWILMVAAALAAGFYSQIIGGDWGAFGITLVAAAIGQIFRSLIQAKGYSVSHVTLACGVLSASIAAVGLNLGLGQVIPATLIASVIYLVPGLPLINGFLDVVSNKHLFIGLERIAKAVFLFLLLAIAIEFAYAVFM